MDQRLRELVFSMLGTKESSLSFLVFLLRNNQIFHTLVTQCGLKTYYNKHCKTPMLYKKEIFQRSIILYYSIKWAVNQTKDYDISVSGMGWPVWTLNPVRELSLRRHPTSLPAGAGSCFLWRKGIGAGLSKGRPRHTFLAPYFTLPALTLIRISRKKNFWITVCFNFFRSTPMNTVFPLLQSCFLL
jgi:hypothetical protein